MPSPYERTLDLIKKDVSDKDELYSSRNSHTSPVDKKGDKKQLLGSRQTHTSKDRTTCGSKCTYGLIASSRVMSKLYTTKDSRSMCSSGSRSPESNRSAIQQKTTKTRKSSESRSRSPYYKKVARQQKKSRQEIFQGQGQVNESRGQTEATQDHRQGQSRDLDIIQKNHIERL